MIWKQQNLQALFSSSFSVFHPLKHRIMSFKADGNEWTTLQTIKARCPSWNPLCFGSSIWISTDYDDGEKGMVEYDCTTNTIKQVVSYPNGVAPSYHTVCKYKDDTIVIADGYRGVVVTFNVNTKSFSEPVPIPKVGRWCSAIAVQEYIHIFHGQDNKKSEYVVHSMNERTVNTFKDESCSVPMRDVAVTKGEGNTYYKFGGYDWSTNKPVNSFYIGSLTNNDGSKPLHWKKTNKFTLKKPLSYFGYVQREPFIVILGGYSSGCEDIVCILDLRDDSGWKPAAFTCPIKSSYTATLDNDENIHLFTYGDKKHFSVGIKTLGIDLEGNDDEKKEDDVDGVFAVCFLWSQNGYFVNSF